MEAIAPSPKSRYRRLPLALLGVAGAGVAMLLREVDPYAAQSPLPTCPFHALTGLYCPGCGSTRALYSLLHGDVARAMTMNPLMVIAMPGVLLMMLYACDLLPRSLHRPARALERPLAWLFVLLAYAVLRNLPFAPFSLLAPH